MTKYLSILGSTGSIGRQTLEVVEQMPGIKVTALAAGTNVERMAQQCRQFLPELAVMGDEASAKALKDAIGDLPIRVLWGMEGLIAAAEQSGFDLRVTGAPSLFYLRIADDPTLMLHQEWIAECVKRGVFFTNHHNHFINAALTDADIAETVDIAEEAFEVVRKRH